jgi:2-keto-4-pentenoate hydratase/2-oxohepta-3-ene-1,7-dioic acid hydratase in catechol pathway
MKLVTFEISTPVGRFVRVGALHHQTIVDLNMAYALMLAELGEAQPYRLAGAEVPTTMLELLEGGTSAMNKASHAFDVVTQMDGPPHGPSGETILFDKERVRLLAPLPNPSSLRDFIAFEDHISATSKRRGQPIPPEWYHAPVYYKGNPRTIIGPQDDLLWPLNTTKLDYELEMACVIGQRGKNISVKDAERFIAGYTIMNDFSARDIQFQEMKCRLGPAKGKDFATALGPCLVTPDEMPDMNGLTMIARVNGEIWSEGRFGTIYWTFSQMIEHVSQDELIYPGDVFGSGTVGGGCGLEFDRFLKPDDVVELEIQPIGILRTRIVHGTNYENRD